MNLEIRRCQEGDIAALTDIYNDAVINTTATFDTQPKTIAQQKQWFQQHQEPYIILVATADGDKVAGFVSLTAWSGRCAYSKTAELSVYVDPVQHKKGIGSQLMVAAMKMAKELGLRTLISRIAEGNEHSVRMHHKLGFSDIGTMRQVGEKFGRVLDVQLLQVML